MSDYYVPNHRIIPRIQQDKAFTCWLYAAAMLKSWQIGKQVQPSEVATYCNEKTVSYSRFQKMVDDLYDDGDKDGLSAEIAPLFFKELSFAPVFNVSKPEDWIPALKKYGPLLVLRNNPKHARMLIGAWQYREGDNNQVILIDPEFGTERRVLMEHFEVEIGSMAASMGWNNCIWYAPKPVPPVKKEKKR